METIRLLEINDIQKLKAINLELGITIPGDILLESLEQFSSGTLPFNHFIYVLVAPFENTDLIRGGIYFGHKEKVWDLRWIGVETKFQGLGYGTMLLKTCFEYKTNQSGAQLLVETPSTTDYAQMVDFLLKRKYIQINVYANFY